MLNFYMKRITIITLITLFILVGIPALVMLGFSGGTDLIAYKIKGLSNPDKLIAQYTCRNGTQLKLIHQFVTIPGNYLETNMPAEYLHQDFLHIYENGTEVLNVFLQNGSSLAFWIPQNSGPSSSYYDTIPPAIICIKEASTTIPVVTPFIKPLQTYLQALYKP